MDTIAFLSSIALLDNTAFLWHDDIPSEMFLIGNKVLPCENSSIRIKVTDATINFGHKLNSI
jgi:hypothetical protein